VVVSPVEGKGVGQEKQHNRDVQPPGGQWHHGHDQADFKQYGMNGAGAQRPLKIQATLGPPVLSVSHFVLESAS
jgi:hypothetical protein